MTNRTNPWALILAAGDGTRLRQLTTTSGGVAVPKQFCALDNGPSLLEGALERARGIAAQEQICAIVAARHEPWWSVQLDALSSPNLIVQPENRGTANGILLPLLRILDRDPDARIVLLPSDHHVREEARLARTLRQAAGRGGFAEAEIVLLGLEPHEADPELGYIIPADGGSAGVRKIERFVEKPEATLARMLIDQGGLWNAFIIAANGRALLRLFERRCPSIVRAMRTIVTDGADGADGSRALAKLYADLPELDFSRHVLQGQERYLRVLAVPDCGWSDLGTPQRVAEAVGKLEQASPSGAPRPGRSRAFLSLAAQHRRLGAMGARDGAYQAARWAAVN
jgi:mannose-1-phosphate guanylyltransferase